MDEQSEAKPETEVKPETMPASQQQSTESAHSAPVAAGQAEIAPSVEQLGQLLKHPMVNKYLGKATKIVAVCAISGCILMVVAITAVCNLFNQILSNLGSH